MKLGEIRSSRTTTNEPNEPSRAREISARRSPSRAGITLLIHWLRGGSARSYARLVWLVCDARRVCSARCQPCDNSQDYLSFLDRKTLSHYCDKVGDKEPSSPNPVEETEKNQKPKWFSVRDLTRHVS